MNFLPIALALAEAPVIIIGGSDEGVRKAQRLARITTNVTFIAPKIPDSVRQLGFTLKERDFEEICCQTGSKLFTFFKYGWWNLVVHTDLQQLVCHTEKQKISP